MGVDEAEHMAVWSRALERLAGGVYLGLGERGATVRAGDPERSAAAQREPAAAARRRADRDLSGAGCDHPMPFGPRSGGARGPAGAKQLAILAEQHERAEPGR